MARRRPPAGSTDAAEPSGAELSGGALATLIGIALLIVFMVQNREYVTLHFLWWSFTWPLWASTLLTAVLGALVWMGLGVLRRHRRRQARRD